MYPYLLSAGSLMREKGWAFFFFKPQLVPIFAGLLCNFELYMTVSSRCPWTTYSSQAKFSLLLAFVKKVLTQYCPCWIAQLVKSVIPICQDCGFSPPSGHIQESTSECTKKNSKSMFLSLSLSLKTNRKNHTVLYKQTQMRTRRTREIWIDAVIAPASISWLWYCIIVLPLGGTGWSIHRIFLHITYICIDVTF